jgi:hypothetical protein
VNGGSTTAGAGLLQWPYGGATNQQWVAEDAGSRYYKLKCVKSSLYIDVSGASASDGADQVIGKNAWQTAVTNFSPGVYFIKLVKNNVVNIKKIVRE